MSYTNLVEGNTTNKENLWLDSCIEFDKILAQLPLTKDAQDRMFQRFPNLTWPPGFKEFLIANRIPQTEFWLKRNAKVGRYKVETGASPTTKINSGESKSDQFQGLKQHIYLIEKRPAKSALQKTDAQIMEKYHMDWFPSCWIAFVCCGAPAGRKMITNFMITSKSSGRCTSRSR